MKQKESIKKFSHKYFRLNSNFMKARWSKFLGFPTKVSVSIEFQAMKDLRKANDLAFR